MSIRLLPVPRFQILDTNGDPLSGGKVYTYQPGTSTPKATYTDYTGSAANDNPTILDSRGEATIYWDGTYNVIVKDSADVTVWTEDNYGEGYDSVLQGNFNLVKNGSFETDTNGDSLPDDWTIVEYTDGVVSRDATTNQHGLYALKFLSLGTGGGYADSDYFEVQEAIDYSLRFAHKSSVADIHNQVDFVWYTGAKAVLSTTTVYNEAAANPTSWTTSTYSATAPTDARFAKLRVYGAKDDDVTAGTFWVDNILVTDATAAVSVSFPNVAAQVTASDTELNVLDGATVTTAELNILDGVTADATELNILDGATVTTSELNLLDGAVIVGWNLAVAEYSNKSGDVSGQTINAVGMAFNAEETKLYVVDNFLDAVYQYSVNGGDASTISYDSKTKGISAEAVEPRDVKFNADGSAMYILDLTTATVYQYTVSTPGEVDTASYASKSVSVAAQESNPQAFAFNSDFSKMYVVGATNDTVYQYTLATPGDMATASYASKSFSIASETTSADGLFVDSSGERMYVSGGGDVYQYALKTPDDVGTASNTGKKSNASVVGVASGAVLFASNGRRFYTLSQTANTVYQYSANLLAIQ